MDLDQSEDVSVVCQTRPEFIAGFVSNDTSEPPGWWELHLRKARGEALSEEEQRAYDAELARQEREAPPLMSDLDSLRKLREQVLQLARANAELGARVRELEGEVQRLERALSKETRRAIGVED